jgi:hypothetical protein
MCALHKCLPESSEIPPALLLKNSTFGSATLVRLVFTDALDRICKSLSGVLLARHTARSFGIAATASILR